MKAILKRIKREPECTIGELTIDGNKFATLELPWLNNLKMVSCIPPGVYCCKQIESPSRGKVYEVTDVEGREHILIHVGNFPRDTEGCILIGMQPGVNMINNSKIALAKLFEITKDEPFALVIEA